MTSRVSAFLLSIVAFAFVFTGLCQGQANTRTVRSNNFARKGAVRFGAGDFHTCIANGDGTVSCWGRNNFGQLGNGTTVDSAAPVTVLARSFNGAATTIILTPLFGPLTTSTPLTNAIAVEGGGQFACALIADGTVQCWGENDFGQLGIGTLQNQSTAVEVSGLTNVLSIAAGEDHACAVLADGTVRCWGRNDFGQLGIFGSGQPTPVAVTALGATIVQVAAGLSHTCALKANGDVLCWGSNVQGQLGTGQLGGSSPIPVLLSRLHNVVSLTANAANTCALLANGTVQCWGDNTRGGVGDNTFISRTIPTTVVVVNNVVALASSPGASHTCALISDGTVRCWGSNFNGVLGDGTTITPPRAVAVINLPRAVAITAGQRHTCALLPNEVVRCWGFDSTVTDGVYANGIPTTVTVSAGVVAEQVRAGANHNCALRVNGQVACFGDNSSGQLGDSTTTSSATPVTAGLPINVVAIATSSSASHSCALLDDGTVACWGANDSGQLGDGSTTAQPIPVGVIGLGNVVAIATGGAHTCALLGDSTVRCWGSDRFGQLGDDNTIDEPFPVAVKNLNNVTAIAAGGNFTCALLVVGVVQCWGDNSLGQLGDDPTATVTSRGLPGVTVTGLTGAVAIAAGPSHACAVAVGVATQPGTIASAVLCWGDGFSVQPDNIVHATRDAPGPVFIVPGLSNVTGVTAGDGFVCALISAGAIRCLGKNSSGQLGDGTTVTTFATPTQPPLGNLISVSAGASHTCMLRSDGQVLCFGDGVLIATQVPSFNFNIDPAVWLNNNGRVAIVTVQTVCTAGESVHADATLRQGPAIGRGSADSTCAGGQISLPIRVSVSSPSSFEFGVATAEARGITRNFAGVTRVLEWASAIDFVPTHFEVR